MLRRVAASPKDGHDPWRPGIHETILKAASPHSRGSVVLSEVRRAQQCSALIQN